MNFVKFFALIRQLIIAPMKEQSTFATRISEQKEQDVKQNNDTSRTEACSVGLVLGINSSMRDDGCEILHLAGYSPTAQIQPVNISLSFDLGTGGLLFLCGRVGHSCGIDARHQI